MSEDKVAPLQSPASGVSPRSHPHSATKQSDYFTVEQQQQGEASGDASASHPVHITAGTAVDVVTAEATTEAATEMEKDADNDSDASATTPGDAAPSPGSTSEPPSRKMSASSSVTFRHPMNPALPQGTKKRHDAIRIRGASPPPSR